MDYESAFYSYWFADSHPRPTGAKKLLKKNCFALFLRHFTILGKFKFSQSSKNQVFQTLILSCEIDNESAFYSYGSLLKLRLHFLAFDHVRTPIVCTFYVCSKSSIFLTTYSPLNANVICEGSLLICWRSSKANRS